MNLLKINYTVCVLLVMIVVVGCKRNASVIGNGETTVRNAETTTVKTFNGALLNYNKQSQEGTFALPQDMTNVSKIMMYLKLDCGNSGCPGWDVYANVYVKNKADNKYYEMARYITPYRKSNLELNRGRGFLFDVTDFKSLLSGRTDLEIFAENWSGEQWKISVEFDYEQGKPDYPYYAIVPLMQYNAHSLAGIPYGVPNRFRVNFQMHIPSNAEQTSLRTIISGWGHADNTVANGNCAEWCPRTHHIFLNGLEASFSHEMHLLPCERITIKDQVGDWRRGRAGWCPGMEVPIRTNILADSKAGQAVNFEYKLQPWTNTMSSAHGNPNAYYAVSTFVIVKSNTPINDPIVSKNNGSVDKNNNGSVNSK